MKWLELSFFDKFLDHLGSYHVLIVKFFDGMLEAHLVSEGEGEVFLDVSKPKPFNWEQLNADLVEVLQLSNFLQPENVLDDYLFAVLK